MADRGKRCGLCVPFLLAPRDLIFQLAELRIPESAERIQPGIDITQRGRTNRVDTTSPGYLRIQATFPLTPLAFCRKCFLRHLVLFLSRDGGAGLDVSQSDASKRLRTHPGETGLQTASSPPRRLRRFCSNCSNSALPSRQRISGSWRSRNPRCAKPRCTATCSQRSASSCCPSMA